MNTIFFGSSKYVIPVIETLNKEFELTLVITTEQKPTDAVPAYCIKMNIPYISLKSFKDDTWQNKWKLEVEQWQIECAVLADFGLIVPKSLLELFPKGIVNIHPSLLPKFRGPTPGQSAIIEGLDQTGVSIMLLDEEVDHGPLLAQETVKILPNDTADTLYTRLFTIGSKILTNSIRNYLDNSRTPTPQDHTRATYTKILTRESGFIDPANPPLPQQLERIIRGLFPWPGSWSIFKTNSQEVRMKFLPEQRVQIEGKKPVSYKDFMNGYPEAKDFLKKLGLV